MKYYINYGGTLSSVLPIVLINQYNNLNYNQIQDILNLTSISRQSRNVLYQTTKELTIYNNDTELNPNVYQETLQQFLPNFIHLKKLIINGFDVDIDLTRLSRLTELSIVYNNTFANNSIRQLHSLIKLELIECPFINTLGFLQDLPNLQKLTLNSIGDIDSFENFEYLQNLKNLQLININCNDSDGFQFLNGLETLLIKNIRINHLDIFDNLINLKTLILSSNNNIIDIQSISYLSKLEILILDYNEQIINYDDINYLESLLELHIINNNINDTPHIQNLINLKKLNLAYSNITDIADISLPQLEYLDLSGNENINNYDNLRNFTNLKYLNLNNTNIDNLNFLTTLKSISILLLKETLINDIYNLYHLENLKELYLDNTRIRDISPLQHLTNLESISLLGINDISTLQPLYTLKNLKKLDLTNTCMYDQYTDNFNGVEIIF